SLSEAIDRLDGREATEGLLIQDSVRMHHLASSIPELDSPGDDPASAHGQGLFKTGALGIEEDQSDVATFVLQEHAIGRTGPSRRGGIVCCDDPGDRDRIPDRRLCDRALELPVDASRREMKQKVDDPRRTPWFSNEPV